MKAKQSLAVLAASTFPPFISWNTPKNNGKRWKFREILERTRDQRFDSWQNSIRLCHFSNALEMS